MANNHEIEELRQSFLDLESLLNSTYEAVVGNLDGKIGLQNQVRQISADLSILKERFEKLETEMTEFNASQIKNRLYNIEKTLEQLQPESEDTKKKKQIIYGIILCVISLWAIIKVIMPLFVSILNYLK